MASRRDDPPPRTVEQAGADRFHEDWSAAGATTGDNGAVAYPIDAASPTPFTPVPFDKGDPPLPARGDWREAWTDVEMAMQTGAKWEALTPRRTLEAERAVSLAAALVQVGDVSTALTLLEQASTTDARLATLLRDPLLAPLLTNARFRRVRRQSSE